MVWRSPSRNDRRDGTDVQKHVPVPGDPVDKHAHQQVDRLVWRPHRLPLDQAVSSILSRLLTREDLLVLMDFMEAGKLTPVIDRTYPLSEVPDAIRYVEERHPS
jgi:NADPH:quinone reductase-like Zn-dependent oxidoreductase